MLIIAYFPTKRKEDLTMKDETKKIKELKEKVADLELELEDCKYDLKTALTRLELIGLIYQKLTSKDVEELLESAKKRYKKWQGLSSAELYEHNICTMAKNLHSLYTSEAIEELQYFNTLMYGMLLRMENSEVYLKDLTLTDTMKVAKLEHLEQKQASEKQ